MLLVITWFEVISNVVVISLQSKRFSTSYDLLVIEGCKFYPLTYLKGRRLPQGTHIYREPTYINSLVLHLENLIKRG